MTLHVHPDIQSLSPYVPGKPVEELQRELEGLFTSRNASPCADTTSIPATFLRVSVAV